MSLENEFEKLNTADTETWKHHAAVYGAMENGETLLPEEVRNLLENKNSDDEVEQQ